MTIVDQYDSNSRISRKKTSKNILIKCVYMYFATLVSDKFNLFIDIFIMKTDKYAL